MKHQAKNKQRNQHMPNSNCLHIDFSAGSYGAGNAFY